MTAMREGLGTSRLLRAWDPKYFIVFVVLMIVITRGAVILTSHDDIQLDLSIYQEVGALVAGGIDPYDSSRNRDARTAIRLRPSNAPVWMKQNEALYDYYVTGNLPGSTALYGFLQVISNGNAKIWRLGFALGDVAIALAAFFLLRRAGVALDTMGKQVTFSLAAIYYPSNIEWGLLLAEDKQFETALMLLLAGLLVAPPAARASASAVAIGAVGAVSVLFKAFGVFLAPLVLQYHLRRPQREFWLALGAAAIVVLPFALYFDLSFIRLVLARAANGSALSNGALHASPWQLIPFPAVFVARPLLCAVLSLWVVAAHVRGRLDTLNLCAALCLIAVCLWLVGASMDRMNVAMMFAMFCTVTVSIRFWRTLVLVSFVAQLVIYTPVIARTRWLAFFDVETPDALATAIFLATYFLLLWRESRTAEAARKHTADRAEYVRTAAVP